VFQRNPFIYFTSATMSSANPRPITEQAKEAVNAAGQKASDTWEATKQKVSEVRE
jgi:hypothetical protein